MLKFSDNAQGSLAASAEIGATAIVVLAGEGSEFPVMGAGGVDQCFVRIGSNSSNEVVRCTGRTGDSFVCEPLTRRWPAGTEVSLTLNRRAMEALYAELAALVGSGGGGTEPHGFQMLLGDADFVWPAGVSRIKVTVIGAGGGGGGAQSRAESSAKIIAGHGGYPGAGVKYIEGVTPGTHIACVVGVGGMGGIAPLGLGDAAGDGEDGGLTSFGSYISASGGLGGKGLDAYYVIGPDRYGDNGSNGSVFGADYAIWPTAFGSPVPDTYVFTGGYWGEGAGSPGAGGKATGLNPPAEGGNGSNGMILVEW